MSFIDQATQPVVASLDKDRGVPGKRTEARA